MSTRALYTFKGKTAADTWNVYKHHDGNPSGAANVLKTAIDWFAWKAPRYEADEFAASFIAAGKSQWLWDSKLDAKKAKEHGPGGKNSEWNGGGVRMMPQGDPMEVACANCRDIAFHYEIFRSNSGELRVIGYSVDCWESPGKEEMIINCLLDEFPTVASEYEKSRAA